ncbi:twin-arginine translocase TatA/TatE family subunit [Candidatus Aerophobetes bacterium]|uniref:Sec-independent protein translocase protein TatA n=1 Tax=Aerophobetes bacterium TaxID=2030807 RepID=A0A523YMD8_UNCAE|nr:MAG: twin-arginine translocase TatA/TatE family subunit [Candidatus Aerophobetes bacterium]
MFGGLGMWELVVIFGIVFLIFGATRIPEIAKSLGSAIKEFKKSSKEISSDEEEVAKSDSDKKKS